MIRLLIILTVVIAALAGVVPSTGHAQEQATGDGASSSDAKLKRYLAKALRKKLRRHDQIEANLDSMSEILEEQTGHLDAGRYQIHDAITTNSDWQQRQDPANIVANLAGGLTGLLTANPMLSMLAVGLLGGGAGVGGKKLLDWRKSKRTNADAPHVTNIANATQPWARARSG